MNTILVDAMNLAFRSHYAFRGLSHRGQPTGALYGFVTQLQRLRTRFPGQIIVCWDQRPEIDASPGWRTRIFPKYKSKRVVTEDSKIVRGQIEKLVALSHMMGFENLYRPGLEADDLMGLYAYAWGKRNICQMFSTDRDLYQLLEHERVSILRPGANGIETITQTDAEGTYGIEMKLWPHFLALGGDACDDIHVLPNVGPKTALKLIAAGTRADRPWSKQPHCVREGHGAWKELWPDVQAVFAVASIPRSPQEAKITLGLGLQEAKALSPQPEGQESRTDRAQSFLLFCTAHGLNSFITERRSLIR